MANPITLFRGIKNFFFDVDGVFTDGGLISHDDGVLVRVMNAKDGHALKKIIQAGFHICIITAGDSIGVMKRMEKLGVIHMHSKARKKGEILKAHCLEHGLELSESLFVGDDVSDIPAMELVKLSCCPKDATVEVKQMATYVSPYGGGKGCVRDVAQKVLALQGKW